MVTLTTQPSFVKWLVEILWSSVLYTFLTRGGGNSFAMDRPLRHLPPLSPPWSQSSVPGTPKRENTCTRKITSLANTNRTASSYILYWPLTKKKIVTKKSVFRVIKTSVQCKVFSCNELLACCLYVSDLGNWTQAYSSILLCMSSLSQIEVFK